MKIKQSKGKSDHKQQRDIAVRGQQPSCHWISFIIEANYQSRCVDESGWGIRPFNSISSYVMRYLPPKGLMTFRKDGGVGGGGECCGLREKNRGQ